MSGYELGKTKLAWSRKAPLRMIGYTMPVITLAVLDLWIRPQDEIGWVAVGFGVSLSLIVPLATLSQARSEIGTRQKRRYSSDQSLSVLEERPSLEPGFAGPNGETAMEDFLASQP